MPTNNVNAIVARVREKLAAIEAGDPARAAWIGIQDDVRRLYDGRTQTEVGDLIGKKSTWVSDLLAWDAARAALPFGGDARPNMRSTTDRAAAKKVLRDPNERKKTLAELDLEDAEEVMGDALDVVQRKSPNPDRRRKREQREFSDEAHNHTELAWDHLRARTSLFADVPVSERETQQLEWSRMVVEQLLGDEMDDELREVLENA